MTPANIIGGILFSVIGLLALRYGKRQVDIKAMIIGALLIVFPYFVPNTIMLYLIGLVLTVALFFPS